MELEWRTLLTFLIVVWPSFLAHATPVSPRRNGGDVIQAADDIRLGSRPDLTNGKKAMTLKKDTMERVYNPDAMAVPVDSSSGSDPSIGGATDSGMSDVVGIPQVADDNGNGGKNSALDPRFVGLIRALVYKIEMLAEEEYLRNEIQNMLDYQYPVEGTPILKSGPLPDVLKLQDSDARPVKVGGDNMASVEVEVKPVENEQRADGLLAQLASLPHHHPQQQQQQQQQQQGRDIQTGIKKRSM